jgi:formate/nitrite transporter FocA (FNT family)
MAISSINYGPATVAKSSLLQAEFTNRQRATMVSINSFLGSIFYSLAAVLIGFLADKFNPVVAIISGQICLLSVIYLYRKLFTLNLVLPTASAVK